MAQPLPPTPVKYFIAILFHDETARKGAVQELVCRYGEVDIEGDDHLFDVTDYYVPEMGAPLKRRIISLCQLYSPELLADMKIECNAIEQITARDSKRAVNLDVGYLDHNKILLASAKEAGQKIYLSKGIYADLAGRYKAGAYVPFEWSFPDFRDGRYDRELLAMRTAYLQQVRSWKKSHP